MMEFPQLKRVLKYFALKYENYSNWGKWAFFLRHFYFPDKTGTHKHNLVLVGFTLAVARFGSILRSLRICSPSKAFSTLAPSSKRMKPNPRDRPDTST